MIIVDTISEHEVDEMVDVLCNELHNRNFEPNHLIIVMDGGYVLSRKILDKYRDIGSENTMRIKFRKYDFAQR